MYSKPWQCRASESSTGDRITDLRDRIGGPAVHQRLITGLCPGIQGRPPPNTFGTRAFFSRRPTVLNSLPDHLRDLAVDCEQFRRDLKKKYLFAGHSKHLCMEVLRNRALQIDICLLTYFLLTYLLTSIRWRQTTKLSDIAQRVEGHLQGRI